MSITPTTTKPCYSAYEPCHSAYEPCYSAYKPCHSAYEPCHSAYEPCHSVYEPCHSAYEPCYSAYEPCHSAYEPCYSAYEPAIQPMSPAIVHASPAIQPMSPAIQPMSPAIVHASTVFVSSNPAIAHASPVSPGTLSSSFAASVHVSRVPTPTKYYAIRRGRVLFPTIVLTWPDYSVLVDGYPNAEFKFFRRLADVEAWLFPTEEPPNFAVLALHTDDTSAPSLPLSVSRDQLAQRAVEGGITITQTSRRHGPTLNANAPEWHPARTSRPHSKEPKRNPQYLNTNPKPNISKNSSFQSKFTLRSQNSLALPAIDSISPRNGGYLFFADDNDHEAYEERVLLTHSNDLQAFPFLSSKSSVRILQQIRDKKRPDYRLRTLRPSGSLDVLRQWCFTHRYSNGISSPFSSI